MKDSKHQHQFVRQLAARVIGCVALSTLSGCYYLQAAQGQMRLLASREPIAQVVNKPETDATVRQRLLYVRAAREFAVRELHLPDNASYTSFVQLNRPYVVWNVYAAAQFSVRPQQWCFPIAGCVVYRGYFSEAAAQRFALRLRARGFDAEVSGAPAYSTLGHFDDPVLSSMLSWGNAQLAATLFHELAHQVVYVPGDSQFNEAFATVVEEAGLKRWLQARNEVSALTNWQLRRERSQAFSQLLFNARERLQTLYAEPLSSVDKEYRKQQAFGQLKFDYQQLKASWQGYAGYDAWFERRLSNADLIAIATYQRCVPGLTRLLEQLDGNLPLFYDEVKKLARQPMTRQAVCD